MHVTTMPSLHVSTMPSLFAIGVMVFEMFLVFPIRPRDRKIMRLYEQEPLRVSHHPPTFCDHKQCGCGDIMVLVCRVIWHDHMIKGSYDFMSRTPSCKLTPANSGGH